MHLFGKQAASMVMRSIGSKDSQSSQQSTVDRPLCLRVRSYMQWLVDEEAVLLPTAADACRMFSRRRKNATLAAVSEVVQMTYPSCIMALIPAVYPDLS